MEYACCGKNHSWGREVNSLMAVLEPEAIVLQSKAKTSEEIVLILARKLERLGYVRPSFANAVVERERSFPTGLTMEGGGNVALPHTDPCHVLKAGVALATLKESVAFANMEDPGEHVGVDVVFLLAINDKDRQIEALQTIIATIQDAPAMRALKCARTLAEIKSVFG
ncbi:PTS sugar transporter subunit IIA [Verminephrobacter eiseniae]|nr:PTS sugar transporter subunit IIA [Verminephrobacter eiseniae]